MKIRSPFVTLLVGALLAAAVTYLSVRAHDDATSPPPATPTNPYAAVPYAAVGVAP